MNDADGLELWYLPGMKRHRKSRVSSADPIAERMRMNLELLQHLAVAVAANETAQRKFRNAVLIRLSRIETIVQMVHGAQIVEAHARGPQSEERINTHTNDAEEFISKKSEELGLKMVRYIYSEPEAPEVRWDRRRRWFGWEI